MKHFYVIPLLAMTAMTAAAAEPMLVPDTASMSLIPAELTVDHQTMLVMAGESRSEDYSYDYPVSFAIYDKNLTLVEQFAPKTLHKLSYTQWEQSPVFGYQPPKFSYDDEPRPAGLNDDLTLDQLCEEFGAQKCVVDGEEVAAIEFYWPHEFGNEYPTYFYKKINGTWCIVYRYYMEPVYGSTGVLNDKVYAAAEAFPHFSFDGYVNDYSNDCEVYLTQTFFNTDANYEYLFPVAGIKTFEEKNSEGYVRGGERVVVEAIQVLNDKGAVVREFEIPAAYQSDYVDAEIFALADVKYLSVQTDDAEMIFRADGTNGIKPVIVNRSATRIAPRMPRRGESVKVELSEPASGAGFVSVVAINGSEALRVKIESGARSAEIPTSRLAAGNYVVVVNANGTATESAKIIVR